MVNWTVLLFLFGFCATVKGQCKEILKDTADTVQCASSVEVISEVSYVYAGPVIGSCGATPLPKGPLLNATNAYTVVALSGPVAPSSTLSNFNCLGANSCSVDCRSAYFLGAQIEKCVVEVKCSRKVVFSSAPEVWTRGQGLPVSVSLGYRPRGRVSVLCRCSGYRSNLLGGFKCSQSTPLIFTNSDSVQSGRYNAPQQAMLTLDGVLNSYSGPIMIQCFVTEVDGKPAPAPLISSQPIQVCVRSELSSPLVCQLPSMSTYCSGCAPTNIPRSLIVAGSTSIGMGLRFGKRGVGAFEITQDTGTAIISGDIEAQSVSFDGFYTANKLTTGPLGQGYIQVPGSSSPTFKSQLETSFDAFSDGFSFLSNGFLQWGQERLTYLHNGPLSSSVSFKLLTDGDRNHNLPSPCDGFISEATVTLGPTSQVQLDGMTEILLQFYENEEALDVSASFYKSGSPIGHKLFKEIDTSVFSATTSVPSQVLIKEGELIAVAIRSADFTPATLTYFRVDVTVACASKSF